MLNLCGETDCIWYHTLALPKVISKKKVSKRLLYTHPFWQGVLQVHVASAFLLLYPFWQGAFVMALGNTMKPKQST